MPDKRVQGVKDSRGRGTDHVVGPVKSENCSCVVIPAQAGIQYCQLVVDPRLRGDDIQTDPREKGRRSDPRLRGDDMPDAFCGTIAIDIHSVWQMDFHSTPGPLGSSNPISQSAIPHPVSHLTSAAPAAPPTRCETYGETCPPAGLPPGYSPLSVPACPWPWWPGCRRRRRSFPGLSGRPV